VDLFATEVDVSPLQGEELALAKARANEQGDKVSELGVNAPR
jgi:hypothetical protein